MARSQINIKVDGTPKPIFVIRVPDKRVIEQDHMDDIRKTMYDYHVLFVTSDVKEFTFECFLATEEDNTIIERLTKELNENNRNH